MDNDRTNIEGESTEVKDHTRDINKRCKEENTLTTKENREENPSESLSESSRSRLSRRKPAGFGANVTETR
jgi:hypothetical protein